MSLQIWKFNLETAEFVSIQNLDYFKEFSIFQSFKTLDELENIKAFKELKALKQTKAFKELQEFKEFKEFKEFLNCLSFLSYYTNFRALFCADCAIGINPSYIKGHFAKHFIGISNRNQVISKAISIIQLLEVSSLSLSLGTINNFAITYTLKPFQELEILNNLYKCCFCTFVVSKQFNIKKHLKEEHNQEFSNIEDLDLENSYIVIAKGQSLEKNKYFFQVETKDKSKDIFSISNSEIIEEENIEEIQDYSLDQASQLYLQSLETKKEVIYNKANIFLINKEDIISPLQRKTQYIQFLNNRNLKDLFISSSYIKDKDEILDILVLNLQELLYITLERSRHINSTFLQFLNSFQLNITTNKPFKPLLKSQSRINYFNLYSCFLAYIYNSFYNNKYKNNKLYILNKESKGLLEELKHLAILQQKEAISNNLNLKENFKKSIKLYNKKLNNFKLNSFLNVDSENDEENYNSSSSRSSFNSNLSRNSNRLSSSSSTTSNSSFNSNSSSSSSDSNSTTILAKIKSIGESQNVLSNTIKEKLQSLFINLFKQQLALYIFDSPINSFLACYSIRKNLTLKDSLDLSKIYAKFLYCSQLIVLDYSIQQALKENIAIKILSTIQEFMSIYFHNACVSPIANILNNWAYCTQKNKSMSSSSNIIIHPSLKETIIYNKITINKQDIELVFKKAILEANKFLNTKLLFNISIKELKNLTLETFSSFEDIFDNSPYTCFKDYNPNSNFYNNFLLSKVLATPSLKRRFFTIQNNNLIVKTQQLKLYSKKIKEFLKQCLLLIYFTSGLPLRGTELCSFKYLNTNKDKREIILDKASALFILNINSKIKGTKDAREGENIRYLSKSVSKIFLYYIVLIVPFYNSFLIQTNSFKLNTSPYFFYINKELLASKDLSTKVSTFTTSILGKKLNIQTYRQIILGIICYFMQESIDLDTLFLDDSKENDSSIIANQMNHSLTTQDLNYARPNFIFPNIKTSVQLKYLRFCLRYFAYFNILDFDLDSSLLANAIEEENIINTNAKLDYNNSLALRYSKKHTRNISSISTALQTEQVVKKVKLVDLYSISSSTTASNILLNLLREFINNSNAVFTCMEQENLIKSMLLKVPYILGILGTNKGKSLSYLFTSSLATSKYTIVILPLVGLKINMLQRAQDFNIPCSIFEDTEAFNILTLVSLETIITNQNFGNLVDSLIIDNKLNRIIFDECHLIITSRSYRSIMYRIKEILLYKTQFVFLSGTVPLYIETKLKEVLFNPSISIIRGTTTRTNIVYITQEYKSKIEMQQFLEIKNYIEDFTALFSNKDDKILIFCPSVDKIKKLSQFLNCASYYSQLDNKENMLKEFFINKDKYYKTLVSSTALEEGIDYANIRLVVYIDHIYSFLGFLQGTSRAGRDNKEATGIFFYQPDSYTNLDSNITLNIDQIYIQRFITESICKRRVIEEYLDNNLIEQCSNNMSKCCLCLKRLNIQNQTISTILESNKNNQNSRTSFIRFCTILEDLCLPCLLLESLEASKEHKFFNCTKYYNVLHKEFSSIKTKNSFIFKLLKEDSCCFRCFLPTLVCSALKKQGAKCCNSNIMFILFSICLNFYAKLKLDSMLKNLDKVNFYSIAKEFFAKIYIKELNTQAIQGIALLQTLVDIQACIE